MRAWARRRNSPDVTPRYPRGLLRVALLEPGLRESHEGDLLVGSLSAHDIQVVSFCSAHLVVTLRGRLQKRNPS